MQVYDITLGAALKMQKCGPMKLSVEAEWKWLLEKFASTYGVRLSYATLAHLRWVIRYYSSSLSVSSAHGLALFAFVCKMWICGTGGSSGCKAYLRIIGCKLCLQA